jgi:HEAT repeat protein
LPFREEVVVGLATLTLRMQGLAEEELVKQLEAAPAVALDRTAARAESIEAFQAAGRAREVDLTSHDTTLALLDRRGDLSGLPLRRGKACRLTPEAAAHLDECSRSLRTKMGSADAVRELSAGEAKDNNWLKGESVAVLMQMLMAEGTAIRVELTRLLSRIDARQATEALAQLALFDLHPVVREQAIAALAARPAKDYRAALLKGFDHPWRVIADHAAEALIALKMKDAVPELIEVLERPEPGAPYRKGQGLTSYVREMVRINHFQNCLLCHPASIHERDKVRGMVPETNRPIDPQPEVYYAAAPGRAFVRADITYLKQDFSVMLEVANPGLWPARQRFDFFVRERLANATDYQKSAARQKAGPRELQRAAHYALRSLTGNDPGPSAADWKRWALSRSSIGLWF